MSLDQGRGSSRSDQWLRNSPRWRAWSFGHGAAQLGQVWRVRGPPIQPALGQLRAVLQTRAGRRTCTTTGPSAATGPRSGTCSAQHAAARHARAQAVAAQPQRPRRARHHAQGQGHGLRTQGEDRRDGAVHGAHRDPLLRNFLAVGPTPFSPPPRLAPTYAMCPPEPHHVRPRLVHLLPHVELQLRAPTRGVAGCKSGWAWRTTEGGIFVNRQPGKIDCAGGCEHV